MRSRNEVHRFTTELVKRYDLIAGEDLKIGNMTRSAKGTVEEPGTNVQAKSGLNREMLAQTWGLLKMQIAYKAESAGRIYVEVDPRDTSQMCSGCGGIVKKALRDRVHSCPYCGLEVDRDVNAAINILNRGLEKADDRYKPLASGTQLPFIWQVSR